MPDLSWAEVLLRIGVAGGLGAAIGLERQLGLVALRSERPEVVGAEWAE